MRDIQQNGTNKTPKKKHCNEILLTKNGFGHKIQNLTENKTVKEI